MAIRAIGQLAIPVGEGYVTDDELADAIAGVTATFVSAGQLAVTLQDYLTAAGFATFQTQLGFTLAAKADLVGGKIPTSQIPAIATTETIPVASQAAMLALTNAQVQKGDVAIRTDTSAAFILTVEGGQGTLANWAQLNTPGATGITQVNGQTGPVVTLGKGDVGLGLVENIASSTVGRAVYVAATAADARAAIGAGTSSLVIGTTGTTAAAGNDSRLSDARTPTAHTHPATAISDSTTTGRAVLTAANAADARTAIGAGTSNLAIGTTAGTAAAGNDSRLADARTPTAHTHLAAEISDSGLSGREILRAADAVTVRNHIAFTSSTNAIVDPKLATKVGSADSSILQIVKMTQAQYDALGTKVATTLYVIEG